MLEPGNYFKERLHIAGLLEEFECALTIARHISGVAIDAIILDGVGLLSDGSDWFKIRFGLHLFQVSQSHSCVGPRWFLIPMMTRNVLLIPIMLVAVVYMLIIQQVDGNILTSNRWWVMKVHPI